MTAKQYLSRVHHLRRQCESLERKILILRTKAEGLRAITYDKDKVQVSPTNTIEEAVVELSNLEDRYRHLIVAYSEAISTRIDQIQSLPDPRHAEVLMLRYIEEEPNAPGGRMTFDDIAEEMHYTKRQVLRLHGKALTAFEKRYAEDVTKCHF